MEQVTPSWTNPPKHIKTCCDCVGLSLGLSPPGSLFLSHACSHHYLHIDSIHLFFVPWYSEYVLDIVLIMLYGNYLFMNLILHLNYGPFQGKNHVSCL